MTTTLFTLAITISLPAAPASVPPDPQADEVERDADSASGCVNAAFLVVLFGCLGLPVGAIAGAAGGAYVGGQAGESCASGLGSYIYNGTAIGAVAGAGIGAAVGYGLFVLAPTQSDPDSSEGRDERPVVSMAF